MKKHINEKVPPSLCTGCGACVNVCPTSAIRMSEDLEGFLYPEVADDICIECGKCLSTCPVLSYENGNKSKPRILAVRAEDEIRSVSSSGGVFTVLAQQILAEQGIVCGVAFDEKMEVQHILIEKEEDLKRLRGSKYVQSNVKTSYQEIKQILKEGRKVLFTGTPCQNAALRNVLGKDYENLLMVDIICHGVPSQKIFNQYLNEVSAGKKVKDVNFRSKQFGWQSGKVKIEFADGTEYVGSVHDDAFELGFYRNLTLRKSCSECKYSDYPREGDISIGDFWGISEIDASQTDGKGTSIVFLNSEKGNKVFENVKSKFYKVKEFQFEEIGHKIKNRVRGHYPANVNREKFFRTLEKTQNLYESVKTILPDALYKADEAAMHRIYKIGLVSNYLAVNFGGSLTQYALYRILKKWGYTVGMIERPLTARGKADFRNLEKMYLECPYEHEDLLPRMRDIDDMERLNRVCVQFVVGSDQLFQSGLYHELDEFVSLSWARQRKKKIAYAASFGHSKIWGDIDDIGEMGYFLKKYDAFSVREKDAIDICQRHFGFAPEWVLDPVFLCDKEVYKELAAKSKRKRQPHYIASYILDPSEDKQKILRKVMKEKNLPVEIYSEMIHSDKYVAPLGDLNIVKLKVEERLDSIMNCDFFVTDSFHGTCLAIIMGKPFISILNTKRGGSRFPSLLGLFGLENRLINDSKDLESHPNMISESIDYDNVNTILEKEKKRCLMWLRTNLRTPKKNVFSDYDMMKKLIREQQQTIEGLRQELISLAGLLEKEGRYIQNIEEYMAYLNRVKKEYIILMAVKDTAGLALNENIAGKLHELGIECNLQGKHGRSFAAVIDGGRRIYEELGIENEPISVALNIGDSVVELTSRVYQNGNEAVIKWNHVDYAVNHRGINIVLISKQTGKVEDSVCFDTHESGYQCYRKK